MKWKEARRGICEHLKGGKEKGKFYNSIIISKIKEVKKNEAKMLDQFWLLSQCLFIEHILNEAQSYFT